MSSKPERLSLRDARNRLCATYFQETPIDHTGKVVPIRH
jgi:hypothetical protein